VLRFCTPVNDPWRALNLRAVGARTDFDGMQALFVLQVDSMGFISGAWRNNELRLATVF
jgi:hypothetical protein